MRQIRKGPEPPGLTSSRQQTGATYEGYRQKDELRDLLATEQRGLCCYCLSRIRPVTGMMKVEHWRSQTRHPAEQIQYPNLLGACMGGEGQPASRQHCDTRKGDRDFSRNPADPTHRIEENVRLPGTGRIESPDPVFDKEINEILNLNEATLMNNRKAKLDEFLQGLPRTGPRNRSRLERELRRWNGDGGGGALEPFCQIVVYWLRKRLQRARQPV